MVECLSEDRLAFLRYAVELDEDTLENLLETDHLVFVLGLGEQHLLACAGDEDFVTGERTSGRVVATMRDAPRVIRNQEDGVEEPAHSVVDRLGAGECLVTTLMGDDPKSGAEETSEKGVEEPKGDTSSRGSRGRTEGRSKLGSTRSCPCNGLLNVGRTPGEETDSNNVLDKVDGRSKGGALKAVSRDSVQQLLVGEVGDDEPFCQSGQL